jgi:hypothetical protein
MFATLPCARKQPDVAVSHGVRRRRQEVIGQISEHQPGSENHRNPTQPTFCCADYVDNLILTIMADISEARKA